VALAGAALERQVDAAKVDGREGLTGRAAQHRVGHHDHRPLEHVRQRKHVHLLQTLVLHVATGRRRRSLCWRAGRRRATGALSVVC